MIDSNISMEEDTELRDLVVQTLENNGVLAKVRAELRASVFLTLEEQESVLNPEPFLNKSVKQYLASSEGKLLFSLVREFLEYFGLDYTISVFDPETYYGKEYSYVGRKKLCEELGINSKEPLLGEILRNRISGAFNNTQTQTIDSSNTKLDKSSEIVDSPANATFDVSDPKILRKDSISVSTTDTLDKLESNSNCNIQVPLNVTITEKKHNEQTSKTNSSNSEKVQSNETSHTKSLEKRISSENSVGQSNNITNDISAKSNHDEVVTNQSKLNKNQEIGKNKKSLTEYQAVNNIKNMKPIDPMNNIGKKVYFDEIIVGGMKEKVTETKSDEFFLGELPPLSTTNNSIFGDLPPLNGKKASMNDLKELIDIAQGVSQYEEDFTSSASGSANEQSPLKVPIRKESPLKIQESVQNIQSENESEEIDEEIQSSASCLENIVEKNTENSL